MRLFGRSLVLAMCLGLLSRARRFAFTRPRIFHRSRSLERFASTGGAGNRLTSFEHLLPQAGRGGRTRRRIWRLVLRFHVHTACRDYPWPNRLDQSVVPQRADKLVRHHAPIHARKFSERALKPMATFREGAKNCPEMIVINGFRLGVAQRPSCGC
jgi:hypothetical protein